MGARDDLAALDHAIQQRITDSVGKLRFVDDPRQRLVPLRDALHGFWKLRVGDYRVICDIGRGAIEIVLVVRVGHRRDVYSARSQRAIRARSKR